MGSLTEVQHSIVVGTLLGDGSMRCKTNALLEINHSSAQREYVDWKYRHLADLVSTPPRERPGNGSRVACRFVTRSLPVLTPYFRLFYESGRKRAPAVELSPLALAVWFMDDGCRSRNAVYLLNRDKTYHRIRVSVEGTARLAELIEPHMLSGLRYKLPQVTP